MRVLTAWARRGAVPAVLTVVCVLGLVGAALADVDASTPGVVLRQSGHWAVDRAAKTALHVHGGTRQVDARVALPDEAATDARMALQGDTDGFVVGRDRAWAFDRATLAVAPPVPLPATDEEPVGIETPGGPYLVYRNRGTLVRLGTPTAVVEAGGALGPPVRTGDGTVWVHRPDNGALCAFRRGATTLDCGLRASGRGGLTVVGDVATFVDTRAGTASPIRDGSLGSGVALGAALPDDVLLADGSTSARLPVVEPAVPRLRLLDATGVLAGSPAGTPLDVPLGPGTYSAPLVSGEAVAVLELGSSTLLTFTADGAKVAELRLPPGTDASDLHRGEDGRLYVDEDARTHVVAADGTIGTVELGGVGTGTGVAGAAPADALAPVAPPPPGVVTIPQPVTGPEVLAGEPVAGGAPLPLPGGGVVRPGSPPGPTGGGVPVNPPIGPVTPVGDLPTPTGVSATANEDGTITVTWASGATPAGTTFNVRAQSGATAPARSAPVTFSQLVPGNDERFTVQAVNGSTVSRLSEPSPSLTVPAGLPGAPQGLTLIDSGRGGGGNQEQYYALSWTNADMRGGEFLAYRITETNKKGVSSERSTSQAQDDQFGGFRCLTPFTYEVRTVTRTPGTTQELVGPPATVVSPIYDCTIQMSISAQPTGPTSASVSMEIVTPSIETWPAMCDLMFDGVVKWSDKCDLAREAPEITGLTPSTEYTLTLRIDNPHSAKKSTSNTVTITTPAA